MKKNILLFYLLVCFWITPGKAAQFPYTKMTVETGAGPAAVIAADLNNDGHLDIISANASDHTLSLIRGDGKGNFSSFAQGTPSAGENPSDIAAGDFNRDGNIDIAVANHEVRYLTILYGNGEGALSVRPNSRLTVDVSPHPHAIWAGHLNADTYLDLVVDNRNAEGLLLLPGRSDGSFSRNGLSIPVGGDPYRGMAFGDVNNDGFPDVVTPNPNRIAVTLLTGPPFFKNSSRSVFRFHNPAAVNVGDINGDNHLDIIAGSSGSMIGVFIGNGKGEFTEAAASPWRSPVGMKRISVGDINGDGITDAAISSWDSPRIALVLGSSSQIELSFIEAGQNPWGVAMADLNNDGRDDIIVANNGSNDITIFLSK